MNKVWYINKLKSIILLCLFQVDDVRSSTDEPVTDDESSNHGNHNGKHVGNNVSNHVNHTMKGDWPPRDVYEVPKQHSVGLGQQGCKLLWLSHTLTTFLFWPHHSPCSKPRVIRSLSWNWPRFLTSVHSDLVTSFFKQRLTTKVFDHQRLEDENRWSLNLKKKLIYI